MASYSFEHIHLRSPDPEATAMPTVEKDGPTPGASWASVVPLHSRPFQRLRNFAPGANRSTVANGASAVNPPSRNREFPPTR